MSTKSVNARTMDKAGFDMLSEFNQAYLMTCEIKRTYADKIASAQTKLDEVLEKRAALMEEGKSEAEVAQVYPRIEFDKAIRALEYERDEALKPYKATIQACKKTLPNTLFASYAYAMAKGIGATVPKAGVSVKVSDKTAIVITRSFTEDIGEIVRGWKMGHCEDDKAIKKFADIIKGRIAGMVKDNKGGYLKLKGQRTLEELFLLATCHYFVEKGVFTVNEDYTLSIA